MSRIEKLKELFEQNSMHENPDSMNILTFIAEFEDTFKIDLLQHNIEQITSFEYLKEIISSNEIL